MSEDKTDKTTRSWSDRFANLSDDQELLRLLTDVNPTLVFVKDRQGRFQFANKALADVYGVTVEELMGKTDADFNPEITEIEHFLEDDLRVMNEQRELFIGEERVTGPDGQSVWLQTTKRPLINDDGSCNHLLGVSVDITERVEATESERTLRKQLSRYERLDSLGVMAGGIAHDLNNILGPLVGYPELIRAKSKDADIAPLLNEIQMSAERASDIIRDMLTLARRGVYEAHPISAKQCMDEFISSAALRQVRNAHPDTDLALSLQTETPAVLGTESHMHQVLLNLVKNAFEAIPHKGKVTLESRIEHVATEINGFETIPPGNYQTIAISDTGVGIPSQHLEKIFDPFFSNKHQNGTGTGLGLPVVYGIVKDMSGYLELRSELGKGSVFTVRIPIVTSDSDTIGDEPANLRGNARLLVIDDLSSQRDLAVRLLSALGYSVHAAENGTQGAELIRAARDKFDLVIIDMIMGEGMDGLDTYRTIQACDPGIPCILASGYSETERVTSGLREGVSAFVSKPYTMATLGRAVRDALASAVAESA